MKVMSTVIYVCLTTLALTACMSPTANASNPMSFSPMLQADGSRAGDSLSDNDELKIAALQGLLSVTTERSLPLVKKVLNGNSSVEVKRKALFVLGQTEHSDAQALLLDYATRSSELQVEAIRMIGIGGVVESLSRLRSIYSSANSDIKEAVLQAYLIADDTESVYQIAEAAGSDEEFDRAVRVLGAMDARDELGRLYDRDGGRESLMQAYAIAGDLESLGRIARESPDKEQRLVAIRNIGVEGDGWHRWSVNAVENAPSWCCYTWRNKDVQSTACHNEAQSMLEASSRTTEPVKTRKDAIFWMGQVRAQQSATALKRLMFKDEVDEIREHTVFSVSRSSLGNRLALIEQVARKDPSKKVRGQAWFWMSQTGEGEAWQRILTGIEAESSQAVREQAVFALAQLEGDAGTNALIRVIETLKFSRKVRKQALFWLGQSDSDRAADYLTNVLDH